MKKTAKPLSEYPVDVRDAAAELVRASQFYYPEGNARHVDDAFAALVAALTRATPCPHIVSSDEGTHYCALAESSARALEAENAALRDVMELVRWSDDNVFIHATGMEPHEHAGPWVRCSDTFAHATADCEPVPPDEVRPLLDALRASADPWKTCIAWVAKRRGVRPLRVIEEQLGESRR